MSRKFRLSPARQRYGLRREMYQWRSLATKREKSANSATAELSADAVGQETELAQLREMVIRQRAEFDNFRKRTQREKDQIREAASENVLAKLLPVIDNFERAISSAENATDVKPVREGVQMIFTQMYRVLESEGLQQVPALHLPFNPLQHDALASEQRTDVADNHVCEILLQGYLYKEKLLRPAMVKVAKAPADAHAETGG